MNTSAKQEMHSLFPQGGQAPAEYFTGTAWIQPLVAQDTHFNSVIGNVVFEPGARNNWHTHPGGQILIVTDGTGYFQEKGNPIRLLRKGDVVTILPGIVHWHGAAPDQAMTHIAIGTNTHKGVVDWLQPVSDEEYNSFHS